MAKGKAGTSQPFKVKGSKNWYIRYTVPGEGERFESTGTDNEKEARRQLNAKRKAIDDCEIGPRGVTVGRLLDLYLADKNRNRKIPCKSSDGYVRLHLRPAFGNLLAEKLTSDHIDEFITQKKQAEYANASINRYLEALTRAYTIAREERTPPLVKIIPKIEMLDESDNVREGFLTREQYEALLAELPSHLQTLLVLGYHLGMRRSELVKLRWDQVDWHANSIRLEKRQTKTKQSRVAPLYGDLRTWLQAAYTTRDPRCETIVAYNGASVSETKTAWNSARVRAGVSDALVHDLRRAAVRNMLAAGLSEKMAMMISGHKTRSMIDRYQIIDERDIELAGQKMAAYEARQRQLHQEAAEKGKVREEVREVDLNRAPRDAYKV
jgi:integrase